MVIVFSLVSYCILKKKLWSSRWGSWCMVKKRKIVRVFPLGKLVYGNSCWGSWFMVTPHWGRGWVKWLWSSRLGSLFLGRSPLGERVGLHDFSLLGGEGGLHDFFLLGERVSEMGMAFPLRKLVSWFLPAGERGWVA